MKKLAYIAAFLFIITTSLEIEAGNKRTNKLQKEQKAMNKAINDEVKRLVKKAVLNVEKDKAFLSSQLNLMADKNQKLTRENILLLKKNTNAFVYCTLTLCATGLLCLNTYLKYKEFKEASYANN